MLDLRNRVDEADNVPDGNDRREEDKEPEHVDIPLTTKPVCSYHRDGQGESHCTQNLSQAIDLDFK